jgi:dTDP-4-dehydrorhamnose reductase
MMKTQILVTGAGGQVGNEINVIKYQIADADWYFHDRETLDLCDATAVEAFFAATPIDIVFNCAAYTAVDKAESDTLMAHAINTESVATLARCCAKTNTLLLHISTDYVYGSQNRPYIETDQTDPIGVYAETKLAGDIAALSLNAATIVFRTSWVYSTFGNNFVKTMIKLGAERPVLNVIFDQVGTPTYAADLASAMVAIAKQWLADRFPVGDERYGIYHFSNEGVTSWYDFALTIQQICGNECKVLPIETSQYPTPARRPHYSVLNKKKIKDTFGIEIRHWREALMHCMDQLI